MERIRFGIPTLDQLFSPAEPLNECGIELPKTAGTRRGTDGALEGRAVTSLSFIGRTGTGKSLLGLHLCSRYLTDCCEELLSVPKKRTKESDLPKVIYVSTDLTYGRANATWRTFGFDKPNRRKLPFDEAAIFHQQIRNLKIRLTASEFEPSRLSQRVLSKAKANDKRAEVLFVDLASSTAGDDWGLVMRILALLPLRDDTEPKHLIVIDAVEGLEAFSGTLDAHGHQRTRRSRIAQILRTAAKKCHVALVLEESKEGEISPEEYVTDVVIRMWAAKEDDYLRRTLEITKSRGSVHVRGQHNYLIRPKATKEAIAAATTTDEARPDEPPVANAYLHVVHSLHFLTKSGMSQTPQPAACPVQYARLPTPRLLGILPENGLPRGKVTVLTGDEATYKARLGRAFLAGGLGKTSENEENIKEIIVYLTTHNLTREDFVSKIRWHWIHPEKYTKFPDPCTRKQEKRIIFRQLEAHSLNSHTLFYIIRQCIAEAIKRSHKANQDSAECNEAPSQINWKQACRCAKYVRVVIDDWTVIKNSYPQVDQDANFLPFLVRYLESVGVTALIIETSSGRPDQIFYGEPDRELRSLADHHLLTWHVPFYGEDRVAIAAVPPLQDSLQSVVSELRPPPSSYLRSENKQKEPNKDNEPNTEKEPNERLWGDPHFELYTGLEKGEPTPVPLKVHLFALAEGFEDYQKETNALFDRLFGPLPREGHIILGHASPEYAVFRDYARLHGSLKSDHTVVLQVDEYWRPALETKETKRNTGDHGYLQRHTTDTSGRPHHVNDPFRVFQHEINKAGRLPKLFNNEDATLKYRRFWFFCMEGYESLNRYRPHNVDGKAESWPKSLDRFGLVPYYWDFGFLLLKKQAWQDAIAAKVKNVETVYLYCTLSNPGRRPVTWFEFLRACHDVARVNGDHSSPPHIFDMDMLSPQSLACLVLEMWASEIEGRKPANPLFRHLRPQEPTPARSLRSLLDIGPGYVVESKRALFRVALLLSEVLRFDRLFGQNGDFISRAADHKAVAERHWYSTASQARNMSGLDTVVPGRLPGNYSTRGDWFLTVAPESRSVRLGERAIDLLSRRRDNLARLKMGIGLPVRDVYTWTRKKRRRSDRSEEFFRNFDTALPATGTAGDYLSYSDFKKLGAITKKNGQKRGPLQWLWRSEIPYYQQHDRMLEQFLARLLKAAARWNIELKRRNHQVFTLLEKDKREFNRLTKDLYAEFDRHVTHFGQALEKLTSLSADSRDNEEVT